MKVWLVNRGIGENVEDRKPMRIFNTKELAIEWIRKHFEENLEYLDQDFNEYNFNGFSIGNSFSLRSHDVNMK